MAVPDSEEVPGGTGRPSRWLPSIAGTAGGVAGFVLAMTPSLLPRPALFLGIVGGISAAIGYGLGVAVARLLRRIGVPNVSPVARQRVRTIVLVVGAAIAVAFVFLGLSWQNEIRTSLGVPNETGGHLVAGAAAAGTFIGLVALGRFLRHITGRAAHGLAAHLPRPLAVGLGFVLVAMVVSWVVSGLLVNALIGVSDRIYAEKNTGSAEWVVPTGSPVRSGGPGSLVPWETLGREGHAFIAGGPDAADVVAETGRPAVEPVRVYAGLESAATPEERAALAVAELQRTGAFDREVLVVAGVAGTGWLEAGSIDSLEFIWGGDTAIVASQYSYLPSWISFLVDQERAQQEGRALFEAVSSAWSELPPEDRPRLIVYGLSLGSFEIQSAFPTLADLAARTDGAVLAGTPSFTEPWRTITADRDAGSPQWQPVVDGGSTVRFADDGEDLSALGPWSEPRIAFLQHADDPVVWWGFELIAQRPDWLAEELGPAVSPRMMWLPVITFLQVTVDQFFGVNAPNGFGHNYSAHMAQTWADVVGVPEGWTQADTQRVQDHLTG